MFYDVGPPPNTSTSGRRECCQRGSKDCIIHFIYRFRIFRDIHPPLFYARMFHKFHAKVTERYSFYSLLSSLYSVPIVLHHYHSATTVGYGRRNNCGTFLSRYIVILACASPVEAFSTRCASLAITLYLCYAQTSNLNLLLYASYSHMLCACTVCVQVTAHSGFSAWA